MRRFRRLRAAAQPAKPWVRKHSEPNSGRHIEKRSRRFFALEVRDPDSVGAEARIRVAQEQVEVKILRVPDFIRNVDWLANSALLL